MVIANKCDVIKIDELSPEKVSCLDIFKESGIPIFSMSTVTEEGVSEIKQEVTYFIH